MKKNNVEKARVLDRSHLLSNLSDECKKKLRGIDVFDQINSTNQYLLSLPLLEEELPQVCFANTQTQGRGRRGRQWCSTSQTNVYMSLAYGFNCSPIQMSCFSLVVAIGVVRVLQRYKIKAMVKWPNDVLVDNQKIAGILVESKIRAAQKTRLIIGIGLNVDMAQQGDLIDQVWTDICLQLQKNKPPADVMPDINRIAAELLAEVLDLCVEYEKQGFDKFRQEWRSLDVCDNAELRLSYAGETVLGVGAGIDESGCLLVSVAGKVRVFHEADVSVRVS